MPSPLLLPNTKNRLILALSLLGAMALTGCASLVRTEIASIPVAPEWRVPCEEAVQPADPVTASRALTFGNDAAEEAKCWKVIAVAAVAAMDRHNEEAER